MWVACRHNGNWRKPETWKEQEMETLETGDEGREYKVQIDERQRERERGDGGMG